MQGKDFVASYISIVLFLAITAAYLIKDRGFTAVRLVGLNNLIAASANTGTKPCKDCGVRHKRGHLRFPDKEWFTKGNFKALGCWLWTWLK